VPDDPAPSKDSCSPKFTEPPIREVAGDAFFLFSSSKPIIPDGYGRLCPQCGETAWLHTRWCWSCKFDFDRAACARWHPTKLLALSLIANILLACLSIYLAAS